MYRQMAVSRGGYPYAGARGGLLQDIGRGIGKVAKAIAPVAGMVIPGAGTALGLVGGLAGGARPGGSSARGFQGGGTLRLPSVSVTLPGYTPGAGAASGGPGQWPTNKDGTPRRRRKDGKPYKRPSMNVGNARAARRSINRIRGVRKLLKSIEVSLPKRSASRGGSPGAITRREAARAFAH